MLGISGNHVRLTGAGTANGVPADFVVEGDDGSPDRFSIRLSDGYAAAGTVAAGRGVNLKPLGPPRHGRPRSPRPGGGIRGILVASTP